MKILIILLIIFYIMMAFIVMTSVYKSLKDDPDTKEWVSHKLRFVSFMIGIFWVPTFVFIGMHTLITLPFTIIDLMDRNKK